MTTIGEATNLPAVLTTEQAADLLSVSTDHLWALARERRAPVEPLRLGRSLRWPTAPLLAVLGLDDARAGPIARNGAPNPTKAPFALSPLPTGKSGDADAW